jgi:hypothetical protein
MSKYFKLSKNIFGVSSDEEFDSSDEDQSVSSQNLNKVSSYRSTYTRSSCKVVLHDDISSDDDGTKPRCKVFLHDDLSSDDDTNVFGKKFQKPFFNTSLNKKKQSTSLEKKINNSIETIKPVNKNVLNYSQKIISFLKEFINNYKKDKVSIEKILEEWKHKDNITKLQELIISNIPNKKPKKRDPNYPKRAKTAYIYFCLDRRPEIKIQNKNLKMTQIASKLGEKWRNLSPKERLIYIEKSEDDRKRYNQEMDQYKYLKGPKKASSSFIFFCQDMRPKVKKDNPQLNMPQILKKLGELWSTTKNRDKWIKQAKEDSERYIREKAKFDMDEFNKNN